MQKNPEVVVQFVLDEQGKPAFIDHNGLKHYRIRIFLENIPEEIYAANYQLDPSYKNPFREETDRSTGFGFTTTAYGDYSISVSLLGKSRNYLTSCIISKSLFKQYERGVDGDILNAIKHIVEH